MAAIAWRIYMPTKNPALLRGLTMSAVSGGPNLCVGGTPSASDQGSGLSGAWAAFGSGPSDYWVSLNTAPAPHWVAYAFPSPVDIKEFTLGVAGGAYYGQMPEQFELQRFDGDTWVTVQAYSTIWVDTVRQTFTVQTAVIPPPPSAARFFSLLFTGTPPAPCTVTVPLSVTGKMYLINNQTGQTLTFTYFGSTRTASVPTGQRLLIWCDGVNCWPVGPPGLAVGGFVTVTDLAAAISAFNAAWALDLAAIYAALALKAPLASPHLTGIPNVPEAPAGTATDQIASTLFVKLAVAKGIVKPPIGPPTPTLTSRTGSIFCIGGQTTRATFSPPFTTVCLSVSIAPGPLSNVLSPPQITAIGFSVYFGISGIFTQSYNYTAWGY